MMYMITALLSIFLASTVAAHPPHDWGEKTCGAWESVGRCSARQCYQRCTVPGCPQVIVTGERQCGNVGAVPVSIWGPKPGHGGGTGECPPHDYGDEQCGSWSEISPGCKVRHCTRQCSKCRSNGRDRYEDSPSGCF